MRFLLLGIGAVLAGCEMVDPPTHIVHSQRDWRTVATQEDRERLRDWRDAFVSALAAARAAGHQQAIASHGALLQPDAGLGGGPIPNGLYRCRVIKLGAKSPGMLDYVAYPWFRCRVQQEGELQSFAKLTGSQRHVGLIFPNDLVRQVFLGTLILGDEAQAMHYGVDRERDVAGFIERVGSDRWRMIMPRPHFESQIDVMELVPEAAGVR